MSALRACPKCRALLEPGDRACPYCGSASARRMPVSVEHEARATSRLGLGLIGVHCALYLLMLLLDPERGDREAGSFEPSETALVAFGISEPYLVATCGQVWRLLSAVFLHLDLLHLLFNCFAVFMLLPPAAGTFGPWRTTCVYIASGVLAAAASHLVGNAGAGASGAICGLIGALAVYGLRRGGEEGRQLTRGMVGWAFMIVVYGFLVPRIDNTAHLAGFASGALLGWFAAAARVHGGLGERLWRAGAVAGLAVVVAVATLGMAPSIVRSFGVRDVELYHAEAERTIRLLDRVSRGGAETPPASFAEGPAGSGALTAAIRSALEAVRSSAGAAEAIDLAWERFLAWEEGLGCSHGLFWTR